jgi:hypothetical protein
VALIDEDAKALIHSRLDRALDKMGNRQFDAEFVRGWRKLQPIILCRHLLRTFKVDDKNVSLRAQLQTIPLPTIFNDTAHADTFQLALAKLTATTLPSADFCLQQTSRSDQGMATSHP